MNEGKFTLVSSDAYRYLDEVSPQDFLSDPLLEEADYLEDVQLKDLPDKVQTDDSDAYKNNLFTDFPKTQHKKPLLIEKILDYIGKGNVVYEYLNNLDETSTKELIEMIAKVKDSFMKDKRDKMFLIPYTGISVGVLDDTNDPMIDLKRKDHLASVMFSQKANSWHGLFLYFNSDFLKKAEVLEVREKDYPKWMVDKYKKR